MKLAVRSANVPVLDNVIVFVVVPDTEIPSTKSFVSVTVSVADVNPVTCPYVSKVISWI